MKNLFKNLILASLFTATAATGFAGNDGGGGGNTTPLEPATKKQILMAIEKIPAAVNFVLDYRAEEYNQVSLSEYNLENYDNLRVALPIIQSEQERRVHYLQFYHSANFIKDYLSKSKPTLKLEETEYCVRTDSSGKVLRTEGSNNPADNSICISLKALEDKKLTKEQLVQKVSGLYMHEVFELMGLTHEEATRGQEIYESNFDDAKVFNSIDPSVESQIELIEFDFEALERFTDKTSGYELCHIINTIATKLTALDYIVAMATSMSTINEAKIREKALGLSIKANNLQYTCIDKKRREAYDKAFTSNGKLKKYTHYENINCYLYRMGGSDLPKLQSEEETTQCLSNLDKEIAEWDNIYEDKSIFQFRYIPHYDYSAAIDEVGVIKKYLNELKLLFSAIPDLEIY